MQKKTSGNKYPKVFDIKDLDSIKKNVLIKGSTNLMKMCIFDINDKYETKIQLSEIHQNLIKKSLSIGMWL